MALSYIYNIFETEHCFECTGDRRLMFSGTKKHAATHWLTEKLEAGETLDVYEVIRFKDGLPHTKTEINVYEFMNIDLGETL